VTQQEGTLWWHAHASALRATVHGAFIIQPCPSQFPFRKPYKLKKMSWKRFGMLLCA